MLRQSERSSLDPPPQGLDGQSDEVRLVNTDVGAPFDIDTSTAFSFTAADVGKFTQLLVRISGGTTNFWRLQRIDLTRVNTGESATYKWVFTAGCDLHPRV